MRALVAATLLLAACGAPDVATTVLHSDGGAYHMELTLSPGAPVTGEGTTTTLTVLHHEDLSPVLDATVGMTPWMPMHDHGIADDVVVEDLGEGVYEGTFAFSMPGSWELRLDIDDGAEIGADTAVATVEVL